MLCFQQLKAVSLPSCILHDRSPSNLYGGQSDDVVFVSLAWGMSQEFNIRYPRSDTGIYAALSNTQV
jgi:hypothetical protein